MDIAKLKEFNSKIKTLESLQAEGLLYSRDLAPLEKDLNQFLKENIEPDSLADRKIKKENAVGIWTTQTIDNTIPKDNKRLPRLKKLLEIYTESIGEDLLASELQISKGEFATPRAYLYRIFSEAKDLIEIQDGYIDQSIFYLLAPALKDSPDIKLHILTDPERINTALISEMETFQKQFPNTEIKKHKNNSHDRYVIIDGLRYFNLGSSIKDLGNKSATITELVEDANIKKLRVDFDSWWNDGQSI